MYRRPPSLRKNLFSRFFLKEGGRLYQAIRGGILNFHMCRHLIFIGCHTFIAEYGIPSESMLHVSIKFYLSLRLLLVLFYNIAVKVFLNVPFHQAKAEQACVRFFKAIRWAKSNRKIKPCKGWFPLSRDFFRAPTCVKFTFANKMEAKYERSHVSVKVEPRSSSRLISALFISPLFYLRD